MTVRAALLSLAALIGALAIVPAHAQDLEQALNSCRGDWSTPRETLIKSCTVVIESGREPKVRAAAFARRGIGHDRNGDTDKAFNDYSRAIELDPNQSGAVLQRGLIYAKRGQYDMALADYRRAIELQPSSLGYQLRAEVYNRQGDYDRALKEYDQAVKLDPTRIMAIMGRAEVYKNKGEIARALDSLTEAIAHNHKSEADLRNAICWMRATSGVDLAAALAECNKSLSLRPNDANILDSRGFVHLKLERFQEAQADYDKALQQNPKSASALFGRGVAKHRLGDSAGGAADIAAAKASDPKIAQAYAKSGVAP